MRPRWREVKPWTGAYISVGQFKVMKDCIVIDCSRDNNSDSQWTFEDRDPDPSECEKAVWDEIALAFSIPVGQDETIAEYAPTQVLAELFRDQGYDGVAYKSALAEGKTLRCSTSAQPTINCTLFRAEFINYAFRQTDNTYYIPKHYPDIAKSVGLDESSPAARVPHVMKVGFPRAHTEHPEEADSGNE